MKTILKGGQTTLHSIRMSLQIVRVLLRWAILIAVISGFIFISLKFDLYELKEVLIFFLAKFLVSIGVDEYTFVLKSRFGSIHHWKAIAIVNNSILIVLANHFLQALFKGLFFGFICSFIATAFIIAVFKYRGRNLEKQRFIRGGRIVSSRKLGFIIAKNNLIKKGINSFYKLGSVPYPYDAEFLHTIIMGSTGTGKTTAILELLDQIRKRGDRAIIYDKMGTFTSLYYNPKTDIILNPLDARSKSWSFFNEIRRDSDYDYLATAFIPEKRSGDPFWIEAARRVFASFARKLVEEKKKQAKEGYDEITNAEFIDLLLKSPYKQLAEFLIGTDSASLISKESEKTSLSILAVLSTYLSSIKYLHDNKESFSIRDWIESQQEEDQIYGKHYDDKKNNEWDDKNRDKEEHQGKEDGKQNNQDNCQDGRHNGFLFISSKGDQHDSLKPLISTWLDIAVKSLLGLDKPESKQRTWIILDELASLQLLPSLLDGLSQSRQFKGAFILSLHSIAQLKSIYGRDLSDTITSLCRNKLFFAVPDAETAEFCSRNLGFQEIEEIKEGISYGAHEVRDGVSLNSQKSLKRLVIPSELMFMSKLSAYIKTASDLPIAKLSFKLQDRDPVAAKYQEIDESIEQNPTKEDSKEDKTDIDAIYNEEELHDVNIEDEQLDIPSQDKIEDDSNIEEVFREDAKEESQDIFKEEPANHDIEEIADIEADLKEELDCEDEQIDEGDISKINESNQEKKTQTSFF